MSQPAETPTATLLRLVNGYQISQAIHVAAALKLADLIGAEPVSVPDITARVGAHPESLHRAHGISVPDPRRPSVGVRRRA